MFKDHIHLLSSAGFSLQDMLLHDEDIDILKTNESMFYYLLKIKRLI